MNISEEYLRRDFRRAHAWWGELIDDAERRHGIPARLLYAIYSRETNFGRHWDVAPPDAAPAGPTLDLLTYFIRNPGDQGHGRGIGQVDDRYHDIPADWSTNVDWQVETSAEILGDNLELWGGDVVPAANTYNSGQGETSRTTGGDYGPDVVERWQFLVSEFPPEKETPMRLVSRTQWGARPASTSTNITPAGVAVHWEGPRMGTPAHGDCPARVRGIQAYHMDSNGWADVAYSAIVCPHGYVFEGRGPGHRTAANGTDDGNQRYYAVCYLGGQGDPFTAEARGGINDAIAWLGGGEVIGHRDMVSTACPGSEIYAWVRNGHPSPVDPAPPAPQPVPPPPVPEEDEDTMRLIGVTNSRGIFLVGTQPLATGKAKAKIPAVYIGTTEEVSALHAAGVAVRDESKADLPEAVFDKRFVVVG